MFLGAKTDKFKKFPYFLMKFSKIIFIYMVMELWIIFVVSIEILLRAHIYYILIV